MQAKTSKRKPVVKTPAKYAAPCLVAVVAVLFSLLLVYPILTMSPRDIPIAVCSLDTGVSVAGEEVVIGEKLIESLTGEDAEAEGEEPAEGEGREPNEPAGGMFAVGEDAVAWTVFSSEDEMNQALEQGEYYAAITIPRDFSERLVAVKGRELLGAQMAGKLPSLAEGTSALAQGLEAVDTGAQKLNDGIGSLAQGAQKLDASAQALPSGAAQLAEGSSALSAGLAQAQGGSTQLVQGLESVTAASGSVKELIAAASQALEAGDYATASACLLKASQASAGTQQALEQLSSGAAGLANGIDAAAQGAQALDSGIGALASGSQALTQGTGGLAQGAGDVQSGAGALSEGLQKLAPGASTLAQGLDTANSALEELPTLQDDDEAADASNSDAEEGLASALDGGLALGATEEDPNVPYLSVLINTSKNPMVTNSLSSAFCSFEAQGIQVRTTSLHEVPSALSTGFAHMPLLIMTYLGSYAAAAVIAMGLKPKRSKRSRMAKGLCAQAALAAVAALLIGFLAAGVFTSILGVSLDYVQLALFLALCSFALQLIVVASLDLFGTPGMAVPLLLMALCMLSAYFPYEFMPAFWQDYIYPWNPLRYMVDGFKEILYAGGGALNGATGTVGIVALVGAAALLLNLAKKPLPEVSAAEAV